ILESLEAQAQELSALRTQLRSEMHRQLMTFRSDVDAQAAELHSAAEARLKETDAALSRTREMLTSLADETRGGHGQLANSLEELAAALREEQRNGKSQQNEEINQRLSELAAEFKEEQRVCFRQLSLEASESAVLED